MLGRTYCVQCCQSLIPNQIKNYDQCMKCNKVLQYQCEICKMTFKLYKEFSLHCRQNCKKVYICSKCNYTTRNLWHLKRHDLRKTPCNIQLINLS